MCFTSAMILFAADYWSVTAPARGQRVEMQLVQPKPIITVLAHLTS